jgi:hypothetical protein
MHLKGTALTKVYISLTHERKWKGFNQATSRVLYCCLQVIGGKFTLDMQFTGLRWRISFTQLISDF